MPEEDAKLAEEIATYRKMLPQWSDREGQFVLIHGSKVEGFYEDYLSAVQAGYGTFGIIPFLVKKVMSERQVHTVTRMFAPRLAD